MRDQFFMQQERQSVHRANNQIRNKLILQARNLMKSTYSVDRNNPDALTKVIATLESFLEIRRSLTPEVAPDGYQREIEGAANKLKYALAQLESKRGLAPAPALDEGKPFFVVTMRVDAMNNIGDATSVCLTYVTVKASSMLKASYAATAYFGDGVTPVSVISDNDGQQSAVDYHEGAGHTIWLKEQNLRYSSIRTLAVSKDEMQIFQCVTTGLTDGNCIIGE